MKALPESFWSKMPFGLGVRILARDANHLIAFDKPMGVLSHPNSREDERRSLLICHYDEIGEFYYWHDLKEGVMDPSYMPRVWLLNRLDAYTSGVILATANEALAHEIRGRFKREEVRKTYRALVFGTVPKPKEAWRDLLLIRKQGGHIRTMDGGNIPAECTMRLVRESRQEPRLSLLELEPHTGRSHQLRVQCARRGLPIVGDATYGEFKRNREFKRRTGCKRLFLHSFETSIDYELNGRKFAFSACSPVPPEFEEFL
ncbi:MAG TPA: RNA pseudouridine synthase [Opitutaceae bacterium]|nr:RNA pseudouridine synthase [Opitutaceae bacterium]